MTDHTSQSANKHTISRAGQIYAGKVVLPGHQAGRIGIPIGNAVTRFKFEGLTAGTVLATMNAATPVGQEIRLDLPVAYFDSTYDFTSLGVVVAFNSTGNDSGKTATVRGLDGAGQPATKQIDLTNAGVAESPIGWKEISTVTLSAALAGTVTLVTTAKYSFPYAVWGDGDELSQVYLDGSVIASPSYTPARTADDTITGDDGRGILDLTTPGVSSSTLVFHLYADRSETDRAIGKPTYNDHQAANFYA